VKASLEHNSNSGATVKTLIVYAHPEPKSLSHSLMDLAVTTLEAAGHDVQVTDLYGS
jgi:NAD(P)H dehydrogenase (quinone)